MKIKSLAAEARIIRQEEKKRGPLWGSLYLHRVLEVRPEQRAALLAYAFIRGRSYEQAEAGAKTAPPLKRAAQLAVKYGGLSRDAARGQLLEWYRGAGPCGRDPGVMTPDRAGSTPAAPTMSG